MLGGSILLDKYSRHIADDIEAGGFTISASFFNVIEGGNHVAMAKTACLTALEFTNGSTRADPDVVVICGDRFEQLAIAMAAAYLNITIAHIEGGDVTGSIDESVRHAITKLAHIHFVTNDDAHRRVLAMGEDPRYVFNTGSLDVELAARVDTDDRPTSRSTRYGVGHDDRHRAAVPDGDPASGDDRARQPRSTSRRRCARWRRSTCRRSGSGRTPTPAPARWPRACGTCASTTPELTAQMRFITNVPADEFVALLANAACVVGNSSAGIKECSYLGTPVVNIGARQQGRLAGGARDARRLRRRARSPRRSPRSSRTAGTRRRPSTTAPTPARPWSTCWRPSSSTRRNAFTRPAQDAAKPRAPCR